MRIQVIKTKAGWYFRVVAKNGKVLCHSETYTRKRNAMEAVEIVKRHSMYCQVEVIS